jgi:hypothetical protein
MRFLVTAIGGTGRSQRVSSELNLKLDVSLRNNKTMLRRIDEEIDQVSSGQQQWLQLILSADYMVSQNLTARMPFLKDLLPILLYPINILILLLLQESACGSHWHNNFIKNNISIL